MPPERDRQEHPAATDLSPATAAAVAGGSPARPSTTGDALGQQADLVTAATVAVEQDGGSTAAGATLPGVLVDVPVAVLVVDQDAGTVTYANTAAIELAGNVRLPVSVGTWGASAGLTDLAGGTLAGTRGPLADVAAGRPVTGEVVRLSPGGSTDRDRADAHAATADQVLWVTGFPLTQAGDDEHLALVVFLQLDPVAHSEAPEAYLQALRERAVLATDIAFTITDPRRPDNPLVWVNPSFTRVTGYEPDEAVGRNCRFLQGPATDEVARAEVRAALAEHRPITTTLLNYRKDGSAFWNQISISPVLDGDGRLVSFVGVQTDVTERVRIERERETAFAAEQTARQEAELARSIAEQARADAEAAHEGAERARARLALMAEATSTLIATLDMAELLDRLAGLCVPRLADWAYLTLVDDHGAVRDVVTRHRDGRESELAEFAELHVQHLPEHAPSRRTMRTSQPVCIEDLSPDVAAEVFTNPGAKEAFDRLGGASLVSVPMVARRRTLGAIALVRSAGSPPFSQNDVHLAADLAGRAALAMDNVRLYQREHSVADTLQRSLLPQLPEIPGLESAAHYVSASSAADVGGDFYDLLRLPDGSVGLVIGDVVGHDVAAAAAMGHLRGLLRACIWDAEDADPGAVLARVDRLVQGLNVTSMATLIYARAVPPTEAGRPWRLHLSNAGHPPPVLRAPGGAVHVLDQVSGLMVGVDETTHRPTHTLEVPTGTTLLAYTDGLIERPGTDLDEGIGELCGRLTAAPAAAGPQELCDAAVSGALDHRDDVALIAVRFG